MHLYSVAVARLDACLALEELTPMQRATALKQRGDAHFAEEQTALALADYERALDLGGPDLDILIALGRVPYEIDNYEAARAVLHRAVALHPERPAAPYWPGLVLYGLGPHHDALFALRKTTPPGARAADANVPRPPRHAQMGSVVH